MGTVNTNVTVTFSAPAGVSTAGALSLSLDSEYNIKIYGQTKSTFAPGQTAYLRLLHGGNIYTMESSIGTIDKVASNVFYTTTENITFANTNTASLSNNPIEKVTWNWIGKDGGQPQFDGKTITMNEAITGVLHCEYQVAGDRLALNVTIPDMGTEIEIPALVVVTQSGNTVFQTVTFTFLAGDVGPVDTNIRVSSYCDDSLVIGAKVYVNNELMGETNSQGICYVGKLMPGVEHKLLVTKHDFTPSNLDVLANDRFVISV